MPQLGNIANLAHAEQVPHLLLNRGCACPEKNCVQRHAAVAQALHSLIDLLGGWYLLAR